AEFVAGTLRRIESSFVDFVHPGGLDMAYDDIIDAGDGRNVVIGGNGSDRLTAGDGDSVILGDNGIALFAADGARERVETTDVAYGGNDVIEVETGNHVLMGGSFDDEITAGGGNHV